MGLKYFILIHVPYIFYYFCTTINNCITNSCIWNTCVTWQGILDFKLSPCSECCMLSSYLPAYEVGTDSVPKRRHIQFRSRGITQKKAYNIKNTANVWNQGMEFIYQLRSCQSSPPCSHTVTNLYTGTLIFSTALPMLKFAACECMD